MMNNLEIAGVLIGILYLYWEYKASSWLWLASIAMPAIYLGVYLKAGLYADFAISIYYIIASIYGLIAWLRTRKENDPAKNANPKSITHVPNSLVAILISAATILTLILGSILSRWTDSTVPWADAFTTALSIVALWMLARKYIEQWWAWIAVDVAYTFLYIYKDLWLTGLLYLAYAVVAIFGYEKWKRMMN